MDAALPHVKWTDIRVSMGPWHRLTTRGFPIWIYCLLDPEDDTIRYVGASRSPRSRLEWHCREQCNRRMRAWIVGLKARDLKPKLVIMGCAQDGRASERSWIAYFRSQGDIYNVLPGGELIQGKKKPSARKKRKKKRKKKRGQSSGRWTLVQKKPGGIWEPTLV